MLLATAINRALALRLICRRLAEEIRNDAALVSELAAAFRREADGLQRGDAGALDGLRARRDRLAQQVQFVLENPGETPQDRAESAARLKELRRERAEERLRSWASGRCLSASSPGLYTRAGAAKPGRRVKGPTARPSDN
jgi:hypothetical protein